MYILSRLAALFFIGWLISAIALAIAGASKAEWAASVMLFGGLFFAWWIALHELKKKDPKLVAEMLQEMPQEEGERQERMARGGH